MGKVLIACECSGKTRNAFRKLGHDAWSCDIQPSDDNSDYHITGDVTPVLKQQWDLIIAHPPCTYLSNSGVRWLYKREDTPEEVERVEQRWRNLKEAREFFLQCLHGNAPKVAVENPVIHKWADLPKHTFSVQPWQFGDNFKKRTCFWTRGLPDLVPTSNLDGSTAVQAVWLMGPSEDRQKKRSETYQGIAGAMATQWGKLL